MICPADGQPCTGDHSIICKRSCVAMMQPAPFATPPADVRDVLDAAVKERLDELHSYIQWLLSNPGYGWGEDGCFTFPNGETFMKGER